MMKHSLSTIVITDGFLELLEVSEIRNTIYKIDFDKNKFWEVSQFC